MPRMPKGTVTFLFTDIEGSTRLWEQHPRAMQAALARHDTILREAIEQNGGYVFKTMGDAFCASFPTAPETLQAAIEAQRALQAADWEAGGVGPIKVRMALHTGAAEVRDKDYFGLPLNRAARLLSAGHGGQVLLSLPTQQLVRDLMPPDTDLLDLGECDLKDLTRPEHIYQLVAPDLPGGFPPIKTLGAHSGNTALLTRSAQIIVEPEPPAELQLRNPYKGLRAFQEADANDFFGREELAQRLLARMSEEAPLTRFLAVVGPSGSGKSSVVRAGLVPALRQGGVPGSERWLVVEMLPGAHPFEELDALLCSIAVNPPATLMELLQADERGLIRAGKRILPRDETIELVLVIDQFEEVFTLIEEEPVRVHFLESLHTAVTDPRSRLRVIVTLRADFFDRPLLYPDPGELMRQRTAVVLPLAADELERAIVKPAEHVGVGLEPELVATIIKDVGEQPGALPLLQYAMTELFERRAGNTMTLAAYRESGGVLGALARRADELYDGLNEEEREATRQLFLRLVTLGEGVEDTRRRVRMQELASLTSIEVGEAEAEAPTPHPSPSKPAPDIPHSAFRIPHSLDRVLDVFGRYRLLTFDRDPITKGPTVEVAHEALIRTWSRLREWLDAGRSDLRVQRQLLTASGEWAEAGRDPSFLATGARLAQFEALREGADRPGGVALTTEEREYLSVSIEEREKQERAEQERQAKELALQKRVASGLRVLVVGLGLFLLVATGLAVFAFNQSSVAQANATEAATQRQQAESSAATAVTSEAEAKDNLRLSEAQRMAADANALIQTHGLAEPIALLAIRSLNTQYTSQGDAILGAAETVAYPLQRFSGYSDIVFGVSFSPDGKYLIIAGDDKPQLWDVQGKALIRKFAGHTDLAKRSVFSPDGKYLLTISNDKTAKLWEVETGNELRTFSGHTGNVNDAAMSFDGEYLATVSSDKTAKLWNIKSGQEVRTFVGHTDVVACVAFSPDGKYLLTGSNDYTAKLWDVQTGLELRTFSGNVRQNHAVALSPDGRYVLTADVGNITKLWDAQTGEEIRTFSGHTSAVYSAVFSPDGKYIMTGSFDNTVRMWNVETGEELRTFSGHTSTVTSLAFSPDGRYALTGSADSTAVLWNAHPLPHAPQFIGHTHTVSEIDFSPDGKYVLTSSYDKTARLWDAQSGQELRSFTGHDDYLESVAFSPDGRYILTGSQDSTARLWDAQTGTEMRRFTPPDTEVINVRISSDGKYVFTGSTDNTARLWNTETGQMLRQFIGHTEAIVGSAFSPDGKYIITTSYDKTMRLWNIETGKEQWRFTFPMDTPTNVVFSPNGKYVLAGNLDSIAYLFDVATRKEIRQFIGHTGEIRGVAFSPDSKYVLTGSDDKTARLWDAETGQELRRFTGHTDIVTSVASSPDGKYVATASEDGTARLWYVDYQEVVQYLCSRLQRDFTDKERAQYGIKDKEPTCPK